MGHDLSPEALADKMSAEQRVKQFVIADPAPVFEVVLIAGGTRYGLCDRALSRSR
jgi:hypothetical protein